MKTTLFDKLNEYDKRLTKIKSDAAELLNSILPEEPVKEKEIIQEAEKIARSLENLGKSREESLQAVTSTPKYQKAKDAVAEYERKVKNYKGVGEDSPVEAIFESLDSLIIDEELEKPTYSKLIKLGQSTGGKTNMHFYAYAEKYIKNHMDELEELESDPSKVDVSEFNLAHTTSKAVKKKIVSLIYAKKVLVAECAGEDYDEKTKEYLRDGRRAATPNKLVRMYSDEHSIKGIAEKNEIREKYLELRRDILNYVDKVNREFLGMWVAGSFVEGRGGIEFAIEKLPELAEELGYESYVEPISTEVWAPLDCFSEPYPQTPQNVKGRGRDVDQLRDERLKEYYSRYRLYLTDAISTLAGNLNIKTETQTKLQKDIERRVTGKEKEVEDNFRNITELSNYMKENAEDINNVFNNGGQLVIDNKVFSKEERGLGLCLLKEVAKDLGANYQADKEDGIITKLYISANGNS